MNGKIDIKWQSHIVDFLEWKGKKENVASKEIRVFPVTHGMDDQVRQTLFECSVISDTHTTY